MLLSEVRGEIDALKRRVRDMEIEIANLPIRIRSETDKTIQGMRDGIESLVVNVIQAELSETKAQLGKLDEVLKLAQEAQTWRATIHKVEVIEQAKAMKDQEEAREDASFTRKLEQAKSLADIQTSIDSRIDGSHKRRMAVLVFLASVLSIALTGGACSAVSHFLK